MLHRHVGQMWLVVQAVVTVLDHHLSRERIIISGSYGHFSGRLPCWLPYTKDMQCNITTTCRAKAPYEPTLARQRGVVAKERVPGGSAGRGRPGAWRTVRREPGGPQTTGRTRRSPT
jgi:hypothetical protein